MVMRMRRQVVREVDAAAIEKRAVKSDRYEHRRIAVLNDADACPLLRSSACHAFLRLATRQLIALAALKPSAKAGRFASALLHP